MLTRKLLPAGKGTVRRKKKVIHKSAGTDDKKLQTSLKKLQVSNIPGIEEVGAVIRKCEVKIQGINYSRQVFRDK